MVNQTTLDGFELVITWFFGLVFTLVAQILASDLALPIIIGLGLMIFGVAYHYLSKIGKGGKA